MTAMPNSPPASSDPATRHQKVIARTVEPAQTLQWLAKAWRDLARCGWISLLHGAVIALAGGLMFWVAREHFWFMAGAFSGFLLVGPVLATSLYALSRGLERGEQPSLATVLSTWFNWKNGRVQPWGEAQWRLVQFGLMLALTGTIWVLLSAALIAWLAPVPITSPKAFIEHVVLAKEGFLFEIWMAIGGALVAPIFASTVVTVPLLLDRQLSLAEAVGTSWQVIFANPVSMAFWGALIMLLTLLGFATALVGLLVIVPLLGHASWHAYRDLLDVSGLPEQESR